MIRVNVSLANATVTETETLTAGRVGLECGFTFSSEWDGLAKVAVFEGAETIEVALGTASIAVVPPECMATAGYNLRVGVYGLSPSEAVVIPTVWAKAGKIKDSAAPDDESFAHATPELVAQIIEKSDTALSVAQNVAEQAASGAFDGAPGVSPTAESEEITGGHRITITDVTGDTVVDVMDGTDGRNGTDGINGTDGSDGVSPEVTITSITGGHRISITDADHPSGQSFDVMDGEDGPEEGFWATYDTTTNAQIEAAYQAGKVVMCLYNSHVYYLSYRMSTAGHRFFYADNNKIYWVNCISNTWSNLSTELYAKPSSGIPKSDLASAVQTSLGKADTAYQKPSGGIPASDLAAGVIPTVPTKTSDLTNDSGFITEVADGSITEAKLAPAVAENVAAVPDLKSDVQQLEEQVFDNVVVTLEANVDYTYTEGYYLALNLPNGKVVTSGANQYGAWAVLNVTAGDEYFVSGRCVVSTSNYPQVGLAFEDRDGNLITSSAGDYDYFCGGTTAGNYNFTDYAVTVPANAVKMYVGTTAKGGSPLTIKKTVVVPIIPKEIASSLAQMVDYEDEIWALIGDSWTEQNIYATKHYYDWISDQLGFTVNNVAVGGSGYKRKEASSDGSHAFYQQALTINPLAKIVTVFGGGNDCSQPYEIGTYTDTTTDTLAGAINTTISNIFATAPNAHVIIFSPAPWTSYYPSDANEGGNMATLTNMIERVCKYRGVKYVDMFHTSGLRPYNSAFRSVYFNADGVHPNAEGQKWMYPAIKAAIMSYLPANE